MAQVIFIGSNGKSQVWFEGTVNECLARLVAYSRQLASGSLKVEGS